MPRSESNFTHSHLDFKNKLPADKPPDPCLQGWGNGEGIKGFIPLKEVQRERTGAIEMEGKRRGRRILLQDLKGG